MGLMPIAEALTLTLDTVQPLKRQEVEYGDSFVRTKSNRVKASSDSPIHASR